MQFSGMVSLSGLMMAHPELLLKIRGLPLILRSKKVMESSPTNQELNRCLLRRESKWKSESTYFSSQKQAVPVERPR
jgi:hypothetical protein